MRKRNPQELCNIILRGIFKKGKVSKKEGSVNEEILDPFPQQENQSKGGESTDKKKDSDR